MKYPQSRHFLNWLIGGVVTLIAVLAGLSQITGLNLQTFWGSESPKTHCIVPELIGLNGEHAKEIILQMGLNYKIQYTVSDNKKDNIVFLQSPKAGLTLTPCQGEILIEVSSNPLAPNNQLDKKSSPRTPQKGTTPSDLKADSNKNFQRKFSSHIIFDTPDKEIFIDKEAPIWLAFSGDNKYLYFSTPIRSGFYFPKYKDGRKISRLEITTLKKSKSHINIGGADDSPVFVSDNDKYFLTFNGLHHGDFPEWPSEMLLIRIADNKLLQHFPIKFLSAFGKNAIPSITGKYVLSSTGYKLYLYDSLTGSPSKILTLPQIVQPGLGSHMVFSPNENYLAVTGGKFVLVYGIRTGGLIAKINPDIGIFVGISGLLFSDKQLIVKFSNGLISVYELNNFNRRQSIQSNLKFNSFGNQIKPFTIGKLFATGAKNGHVTLWNEKGLQKIGTFDHGAAISSIAISRCSKWIASAGEDGKVKFWSTTSLLIFEHD